MKPIIISNFMGVMVSVKYPYRKTPDLYVVAEKHPAYCCQCDKEFPVTEFINHVRNHDRRKGWAEVLTPINGRLHAVKSIGEEE